MATPELVQPGPEDKPRGVPSVVATVGGRRAALLRLLASLAATIAIFSALIVALGENPVDAFDAFWSGSFGNKFNFGQTLMIASLLACTGLAAAIPFQAHLWNVGGEGQLWFGAFASSSNVAGGPESLLDGVATTAGDPVMGSQPVTV